MAINATAPKEKPFAERFLNWRYRNRATITAYSILTPMLIYFVVLVWVPVILLFILSTMHWNIIQWPPNFVGLENYRKILVDPYYQRVFRNTVVLGLAVLAINSIGGFSVALLLNQQIVGRGIFRTIWYIPAILAGAVMAQMMLVFLLPTSGGVMNMILHIVVGMDPVLWQRDTLWMPIWVVVNSTSAEAIHHRPGRRAATRNRNGRSSTGEPCQRALATAVPMPSENHRKVPAIVVPTESGAGSSLAISLIVSDSSARAARAPYSHCSWERCERCASRRCRPHA